jgi:hypothetical protein
MSGDDSTGVDVPKTYGGALHPTMPLTWHAGGGKTAVKPAGLHPGWAGSRNDSEA